MGRLAVVVVAAGKGSRMRTQESKQYLELQGKPILVHTLSLFQRIDEVDTIVLVTGVDDVVRCSGYVEQFGLSKVHHIVPGGAERQHSVHIGLQQLGPDVEWVMVHDGVRPLVSAEHVLSCWRMAQAAEAAVLAVPVKDTIKVVNNAGTIQSTPDRRSLWAIQTPQAFRLSMLKQAYEQADRDGFTGTDDAMLVERIGTPVQVVESDYCNIKITTPEDLRWAEWIMDNVRGENKG
ncbi:2-C-methyl-D-erythritol 4-phosphate cytidylyltransferase [Paenibacillus xerothermodurans]|uniref:2-C-methyl-D-erythritol 4-phosphate cytidylyltransferase n=1 Tax=Paenibacillus xerothermodurans TaxID=1977292 RepID=A0A2W1NJD2_PAEXE|nr:2-C-methyl-D-erythritol 4-phosphate cytidylyltransferase [Paenibacillus xerothermodurans]PZE19163.1 2-C-methyl-D-erythritol 4-phosphate cytidylyltransferase [Paenibacillus xerothermodurans]